LLQSCIGFLLGLSCLFWLENSQQAMFTMVFSLGLLLAIRFIRFWLIKGYFIAPMFGLFWGSFSVVLWLLSTPQLLSSPKVADIEGYICSLPAQHKSTSLYNSEESGGSVRLTFDFCLTQIDEQKVSFYHAHKLRLSIYQASKEQAHSIKAGSYWRFIAKLKPIHGRVNPGGFDYEKWLVSERFVGTGYVKSRQEMSTADSFGARYHRMRQAVFDDLINVIPDTETKGLALALALGERGSISAEQWQTIQNSGTSHLLAISGLHIGIAAVWSYYFCLFIVSRLTFISQKIPAQKVAQIASLVGALSIALLSGFDYPAQRALVMLAVFLYSRWSARHLSLANILALSVIIITFIQPFAVLTVSFWLSVLAVAIIVFLLSYKQKKTSSNIRQAKLWGWLRINWYLFVGLMPITWAVFDSISVVGFIANLILIPLTSFVTTPLIYFAMLILVVSDTLASWIFHIVDKLLALTSQIQLLLSDLNSIASVSSLPMSVFLLLLFATIIILMPAKMPGKPILLPIFLISAVTILQPKSSARFNMVVFDIGQGLAIHISVGNKHLLYDTGYGNDNFSMAESSLLPYFKRMSVGHLDRMIVSHADSDHAGGANTIMEELRVDTLMIGEKRVNKKLTKHHAQGAIDCHTATPWQWSNVKFSFLSHLPSRFYRGNHSSCVLQVEIDDKKILLTGDIEKQSERALLENGLSKYDIVIAPHHGSLTSSTSEFVRQTKPDNVIFSTGYANQWGFPKTQVVKRYADNGAEIFVTHQHGALIVAQNDSGELTISSERSNTQHFWQKISP